MKKVVYLILSTLFFPSSYSMNKYYDLEKGSCSISTVLQPVDPRNRKKQPFKNSYFCAGIATGLGVCTILVTYFGTTLDDIQDNKSIAYGAGSVLCLTGLLCTCVTNCVDTCHRGIKKLRTPSESSFTIQ